MRHGCSVASRPSRPARKNTAGQADRGRKLHAGQLDLTRYTAAEKLLTHQRARPDVSFLGRAFGRKPSLHIGGLTYGMRTVLNITIITTGVICLGSLAAGIYPGLLIDVLLWGVIGALAISPLVGLVACVGLIVVWSRGRLQWARPLWKRLMIVPAFLAVTGALLIVEAPRRVAFWASRARFQQSVSLAPTDGVRKLDRRVGLYWVDKCAADPRGGVYFGVYTGHDGIGPDQMTYGFVYQPNPLGTPFGAARYCTWPLGSDWYCFAASNDWF